MFYYYCFFLQKKDLFIKINIYLWLQKVSDYQRNIYRNKNVFGGIS